MDELDLKGKKYISSKRAAELTGYAKDYVGQLAREGKVIASRMGRSWYVEKEDILRHSGKLPLCDSQHTEEDKKGSVMSKVYSPAPYLGKSLTTLQQQTRHNFSTWSTIRYLDDNSSLIPVPISLKTSHNINIKKDNQNIAIPESRTQKKEYTQQNIQTKFSFDGFVTTPFNKSKKSKHFEEANTVHLPSMQWIVIVPVALIFIASIALFAGLGFSHEWAIEGSQVGNAGYSFNFQVFTFFKTFFLDGVDLIFIFLKVFLNSFEEFFYTGLNFIKSLFNLG